MLTTVTRAMNFLLINCQYYSQVPWVCKYRYKKITNKLTSIIRRLSSSYCLDVEGLPLCFCLFALGKRRRCPGAKTDIVVHLLWAPDYSLVWVLLHIQQNRWWQQCQTQVSMKIGRSDHPPTQSDPCPRSWCWHRMPQKFFAGLM